jgi:hypothetical protein
MKKKMKTVEDHEDYYIHVPKKIFYIFAPLVLVWYTIVFFIGLLIQIGLFVLFIVIGSILLIPRSNMDDKERKECLEYWSGKKTKEFFKNIYIILEE